MPGGKRTALRPSLPRCSPPCAADVVAGLLPNCPEGEAFPLYLWLPCAQQVLLPRLPHPGHEEHLLGTGPGKAPLLTALSLVSRQVCWLTPEQTAGKQKPFMYTQGQAVLNRSFFPGFDTPAVKCTYSATVQVSSSPGGARGTNPNAFPKLSQSKALAVLPPGGARGAGRPRHMEAFGCCRSAARSPCSHGFETIWSITPQIPPAGPQQRRQ